MRRFITAYGNDEDGHVVAVLDCGHGRHMRHEPPASLRAWVNDAQGRADRKGEAVDCLKCDRMELPEEAEAYKTTAWWTHETVPKGVLGNHRTRPGTWGRVEVAEGRIRYVAGPPAAVNAVLEAGDTGIVVPEHPHHVELMGPARFRVVFLKVGGGGHAEPVHFEEPE